MPLIFRSPSPSLVAAAALCAALGWGSSSRAQDPASKPAKTGQAEPDQGDKGKGEGAKPQKPAETPVERHARILKETTVHFDFRRAPIQDILRALAKASDVPRSRAWAARPSS